MRYLIGTSGYNYPEWRGSFYPEKFPTAKMLAYYAERFNTVEVNYTFYRIPTAKLLEGWAQGTPEDFTFDVKAHALMTGQPSEVKRLPKELREALPRDLQKSYEFYHTHLEPQPPERKSAAHFLRAVYRPIKNGYLQSRLGYRQNAGGGPAKG